MDHPKANGAKINVAVQRLGKPCWCRCLMLLLGLQCQQQLVYCATGPDGSTGDREQLKMWVIGLRTQALLTLQMMLPAEWLGDAAEDCRRFHRKPAI
eukprot:795839-Amphidinium_carterae.1